MYFKLKSLTGILTAALLMASCNERVVGPGLLVSTSTGSVNSSTQLLVTVSTPIVPATTPVLLTASVVQNGTPAANGTPVTFVTNLGTFSQSSSPTVTVFTFNGLVSVSMTSTTAGTATVTVTAGGTAQITTVVFTQPFTM